MGDDALRANVLVADDTPANVLAIKQVLEPLQHNVVTASSGHEVLRALLKAEFAVILLDVHMPIMDGFEVAAQIKAREKTRYIPIIFLTAINQAASDVFQGYEAGAVDYLTKPVEPWLVRAKVGAFVDIWLEHKRIERLQSDLAMVEQRQLQALQINEGIVQGIAVAKMALELDDHERALDTLDRTLTAAKRVISHLMLDNVDEIQARDLRAFQ